MKLGITKFTSGAGAGSTEYYARSTGLRAFSGQTGFVESGTPIRFGLYPDPLADLGQSQFLASDHDNLVAGSLFQFVADEDLFTTAEEDEFLTGRLITVTAASTNDASEVNTYVMEITTDMITGGVPGKVSELVDSCQVRLLSVDDQGWRATGGTDTLATITLNNKLAPTYAQQYTVSGETVTITGSGDTIALGSTGLSNLNSRLAVIARGDFVEVNYGS